MKTKQLIGIIVTGLVIIAVGVTGIASDIIKDRFMQKQSTDTVGLLNNVMEENALSLPDRDYFAVVDIVGTIQSGDSPYVSKSAYHHDALIKYVDKLEKSDTNQGIFLRVNSPGGTVYESDEFYLKLKEYKEVTNRPIYAYFESMACSGGYYISMASDYITANRNTETGSIGVIMSMYNMSGLMKKLGIKQDNITSGPNKDMGSVGKEMTEEQRKILQSIVDEYYNNFTGIVAEGRNMDLDTVKKLADGRIYTANQALEAGLIDEVGNEERAKEALIQAAGVSDEIQFYEPENPIGKMQSLLQSASENLFPKSEVQILKELEESKESGVVRYEAR